MGSDDAQVVLATNCPMMLLLWFAEMRCRGSKQGGGGSKLCLHRLCRGNVWGNWAGEGEMVWDGMSALGH